MNLYLRCFIAQLLKTEGKVLYWTDQLFIFSMGYPNMETR